MLILFTDFIGLGGIKMCSTKFHETFRTYSQKLGKIYSGTIMTQLGLHTPFDGQPLKKFILQKAVEVNMEI